MEEEDKMLCGAMERTINIYTSFIGNNLVYDGKHWDESYRKHYKRGHHPFIPHNGIYRILTSLIKIKKDSGCHELKFLDAGCGIGNIVLLAVNCGYTATGIEFDLKLYRIAKKLIGHRGTIIKGDITTFNEYANYDVIYYYQPMTEYTLMKKFVKKLVNTMKVGSYIMVEGTSPLSVLMEDKNGNKIKKIKNSLGTPIYKKEKTT